MVGLAQEIAAAETTYAQIRVGKAHGIGLRDGEVIRTGGKFVKATTGYDLTQLITGSEGTLAVVTEATLRLYPRLEHTATILVPFTTLDEVTAAVPRILDRGVGPLILEYIDLLLLDGRDDPIEAGHGEAVVLAQPLDEAPVRRADDADARQEDEDDRLVQAGPLHGVDPIGCNASADNAADQGVRGRGWNALYPGANTTTYQAALMLTP